MRRVSSNVVIAANASREAIRAVQDAMPLLVSHLIAKDFFVED
jgi:hypothetical protein